MHRILFVDDEPKILTGLRRMLRSQRREWEMEFAHGGVEALKMLHAHPFDVVVSDARMPGMEGSELLEEVRHEFPDTVRIILSGQCNRDSVLRCAGVAHQFLSKPCSAEYLIAAIKHVCAHRSHVAVGNIRALISRVTSLPSQPSIHATFCDFVAGDPNSLQAISEVIMADVAMSAKIMQMVSSGFFGTPQPLIEIPRAVDLLGMDTIRALASMPGFFRSPDAPQFDAALLHDINRHSLAVATAAKGIAESVTGDRDVTVAAYLAGRFHDLCPLMGLSDSCRSSILDGSIEDESKITAYLLALWGLPVELIHVLSNYRHPGAADDATFGALTAVHVAHICVGSAGDRHAHTQTGLDMPYLERTGCADRIDDWRALCQTTQSNEVLL